jgi:hypothetical protein
METARKKTGGNLDKAKFYTAVNNIGGRRRGGYMASYSCAPPKTNDFKNCFA